MWYCAPVFDTDDPAFPICLPLTLFCLLLSRRASTEHNPTATTDTKKLQIHEVR